LSHRYRVSIQSLFKMMVDMHQAIEQLHIGGSLEGYLIVCKTFALKLSLKVILVCQGFDNRSALRSLVVMEDYQFLHD